MRFVMLSAAIMVNKYSIKGEELGVKVSEGSTVVQQQV